MHLALRELEVDAVERNDLAEGLADRARTNGKRWPGGCPPGRRLVMLFGCTRQFVSELGMVAPGTCDGA
jgi:hypothetical protein